MIASMKRIFIAFIFSLCSLTCACSSSNSAITITDVKLTRQLNEKREPVNPTTSFLSTDRAVYCVIYLANAPEGTKVRANWVAVKAEGRRDNEEVGQSSTDAKNSSGMVGLSFSPAGAQLPPGEYKVDIYLDTNDSKQPFPARSVDFTIAAGAAEIVKAMLATEADGKGAVTNPVVGIKKLFCHVTLRGATAGIKISANWIAEDVAGIRNRMIIQQSSTIVGEGQSSADLICESASGLSRGVYRVDLLMGEPARPARSISFTVGQ